MLAVLPVSGKIRTVNILWKNSPKFCKNSNFPTHRWRCKHLEISWQTGRTKKRPQDYLKSERTFIPLVYELEIWNCNISLMSEYIYLWVDDHQCVRLPSLLLFSTFFRWLGNISNTFTYSSTFCQHSQYLSLTCHSGLTEIRNQRHPHFWHEST